MLVLVSFSIFAEPSQNWQSLLKDAQDAVAAGDKTQAHALYKKQAESGNPLAQFTLGWFAKTGWLEGIENRSVACNWFLRSSEHEIPVGLQETGHCYRDAILTSEEPQKTAIDFYQKAQQVGVFAAACDVLIIEVRQLQQKPAKSISLCEQAAMQNALYAQEILIELYADKKALNNNERALYWLKQAAPKSAKSAYRFALTLSNAEDIPEDDVLFWFESSASKGFVPAYLDTAARYYQKITPELEQEKASAYLAKAYLWSQAWLASKDETQATPQWVSRVANETPDTWQAELGKKVEEHLAQFN